MKRFRLIDSVLNVWSKTPDWGRLCMFLFIGCSAAFYAQGGPQNYIHLFKCNKGDLDSCDRITGNEFKVQIKNYAYFKRIADARKKKTERLRILNEERMKQGGLGSGSNFFPENPDPIKNPINSQQLVQSVVDSYEISMRWSCEDAIKKQLKDPRSYKAVKVTYFPHTMNEHPQAVVDTRISFRSKNSFGGYADAFARCAFNRNGEMVRSPNVVSGL